MVDQLLVSCCWTRLNHGLKSQHPQDKPQLQIQVSQLTDHYVAKSCWRIDRIVQKFIHCQIKMMVVSLTTVGGLSSFLCWRPQSLRYRLWSLIKPLIWSFNRFKPSMNTFTELFCLCLFPSEKAGLPSLFLIANSVRLNVVACCDKVSFWNKKLRIHCEKVMSCSW